MLYFDIETGANKWEAIEKFYEPPPPLPEWNESMVAYGNTKDPAKRAAKRAEAFALYQERLASRDAELEEHKRAWLEKAALSPLTGRVLAIGVMDDQDKVQIFHSLDDEQAILRDFWQFISQQDPLESIVGFNIFEFDLPFLVRRSWYCGVSVPYSVHDGHYFDYRFADLLRVWRLGSREYISLDTLSKYFDGPGKPKDVTGVDFAKLYCAEETREQALAYLENDLKITKAIAQKMLVRECT